MDSPSSTCSCSESEGCDTQSEGSECTQGLTKELSTTSDPLRHSTLAAQLPLPSSVTPPELTSRQLRNLTEMVTNPDEYTKQVRDRLQHWTMRKQALAELIIHAKRQLPENKLPTVGKLDLFLVEEIIVYSGQRHLVRQRLGARLPSYGITAIRWKGHYNTRRTKSAREAWPGWSK